jgi:Rho family protein
MVLIGLKSDLRGRNTDGVTYDDGAQLSREFGCASFYEVSSLNFHGITEAMRGTVGAGLTPLGSRKNKRRFNLFRKKKNKSSVQNDDQPHIPPPPVMPKNTVAPWIDIETSSLSTDWSKLINQQQLSDVVFHLGSKLYHSHRYVLSCSSDVMRQIFGIRQKIKCESLSQCVEWDSKRLKELTTEKVNEGLVKGFLSVVTENQSETTIVHITLDSECFTDLSFKYCLEFLYTGYINVTKDSEGIHDIIKAAVLLNLPELQMICENALKGEEELNPSIGTWLNDRNSNVAKELYFNKPFMSDVQFLIEGQVVHAHKIVLASRCDVLGAMLMGGFAESNTHQVTNDTIIFLIESLNRSNYPDCLSSHS